MNHPLAWCANLIALYALILIIWTLIRRPNDLRYAFANLFRQKRRSLVTFLGLARANHPHQSRPYPDP